MIELATNKQLWKLNSLANDLYEEGKHIIHLELPLSRNKATILIATMLENKGKDNVDKP